MVEQHRKAKGCNLQHQGVNIKDVCVKKMQVKYFSINSRKIEIYRLFFKNLTLQSCVPTPNLPTSPCE